jgi:hypothetical protein
LITSDQADCIWNSNTALYLQNHAGGDGQCAAARATVCNTGVTTEMQTPSLDLAGAASATLEFVAAYDDQNPEGGDVAQVLVGSKGGTDWVELLSWNEDHDPSGPGERVTLDLSPYVGSNTIVVSFRYETPAVAGYFEVDQVRVRANGAASE